METLNRSGTRKSGRLRSLARLAAIGMIALGTARGEAGSTTPLFEIEWNAETKEIGIAHDGRRVLVYCSGPRPFKPYVSELLLPGGRNVLLNAPSDHLHHHGLMCGFVVNGVNFWEETDASGYQHSGSEIRRRVLKPPEGLARAEFSHDVYWSTNRNAAAAAVDPLLIERRTISVTLSEDESELTLEWTGDFEIGKAHPEVVLSGNSYHGVGLRLSRPFDQTSRRRDGSGAAYATGLQVAAAAQWGALAQTVRGIELTVGLFNHRDNPGALRLFSMTEPFAYLSATQGLDLQPLHYRAGDRFRLRYLVTLQRGVRPTLTFEKRAREW
jgi:hypothetical protein